MFELAVQTAKLFSADERTSYDIVPSGPFFFTTVPTFLADELYEGRAVARVYPDGEVASLQRAAA